jgi:glucokinase
MPEREPTGRDADRPWSGRVAGQGGLAWLRRRTNVAARDRVFYKAQMVERAGPKLGVDLGGTKILGAIVEGTRVVATVKRSTRAEYGYDAVLKRIARVIEEVCEAASLEPRQLSHVGLAVPGPVANNQLLHAPNLGWTAPPLVRDLAEQTGISRISLANDVNCGALGEALVGAGRGARSVFGLFVGTGLGGGWVLDGKVHEGASGFAAEVGHIPVPGQQAPCGCGQLGCLETVVSKRGLIRMIQAAIAAGQRCEITNFEKVKSREIEAALRAGCAATNSAFNELGQHLGWAVSMLACVLDPDVFVLGGGIAERLGQDLLAPIQAARQASPFIAKHTRFEVRVGELEGNAVAVGAAHLGATA